MSGCIWAPPGWPFGKILSDQKMIGQCQLRKNNFNNLITAWFDEKWDASHLQWQLKLIRFDGREKLCLLGGVRKNLGFLSWLLDTIVRLLKDTIGLFAMFPTAQMCLSRSEKWCLRKIHHLLSWFIFNPAQLFSFSVGSNSSFVQGFDLVFCLFSLDLARFDLGGSYFDCRCSPSVNEKKKRRYGKWRKREDMDKLYVTRMGKWGEEFNRKNITISISQKRPKNIYDHW